MPFTVTKPQPGGKLYIQCQPDGEVMWTGARHKATPMTEPEADWLAAEINRFASVPAEVEGIKAEQEGA